MMFTIWETDSNNNPLKYVDPTGHIWGWLKKIGNFFKAIGGFFKDFGIWLGSIFLGVHNQSVSRTSDAQDQKKEKKKKDGEEDDDDKLKPSVQGEEFIKKREGVSLEPYPDPPGSGKSSIGYGHQIRPGEDFSGRITVDQAEALFHTDVAGYAEAVNRLVTVPLSQNQFDAIVSFAYNVGAEGKDSFADSTLREVLNSGNFERVPSEMRKWKYSGGEENSGLIRRREYEINLFVYGTY